MKQKPKLGTELAARAESLSGDGLERVLDLVEQLESQAKRLVAPTAPADKSVRH
jgi:hypothetical protein